MVSIEKFAHQFEKVSDLDEGDQWQRTRGRAWGVVWATKYLPQEEKALRRLHKFRNWYDSHHDFVWQLEVAANTEIRNRGIPDHLYAEMYGKFPRRSTVSTMWNDLTDRGTPVDGYDDSPGNPAGVYDDFHRLHFAAGFVEGAAAVWEQYLADDLAKKEEQLRHDVVKILRNTPSKRQG